MTRLLYLPGNIPLFIELAMAAAFAWLVSGWFLPGDQLKTSTATSHVASTANALPDLTKLLLTPLFGKMATQVQSANPVAQQSKPVVISPLTIKLLGTVVAKEHGAAIVALAAGREQQVFFIGDVIQPGVTLKAVEAEAIVIERGGKLERVSLEQGVKLTSSPMPKTNVIASITRPKRTPPHITQKSMNRHRLQKQLQNFPTLLSQARVIPHMVNGKPAGFTISEIAPGSLYQQVGLKNGDIVLSVNGKRITDAKQAMTMYQALQSATAIDLELMRAGQIQQIHYDIH